MKLRNVYGGTMIRAGVPNRHGPSDDEPVIHDAQSPYITFSVIDPGTGAPVPHGQRARSGRDEPHQHVNVSAEQPRT